MGSPDVSVIMSVYNTAEEWLRESIESILNQSFSDFEFIIVLDCPTDNSASVVKEYASSDKRIRVIENETNMGLTKSLNRALGIAEGRYIARMDADDISLPQRFEEEIRYLENHDNVAAVGCRCYAPVSHTPIMQDWTEDRELLRVRLLFRNTGLPHPTAMIRRATLTENNIKYDEKIKKSQDYKLWVDLIRYGDIVLLPEILFVYREHENQITANLGSQQSYSFQIAINQARDLLGQMSDHEQKLHCTLAEVDLPGEDVSGLLAYIKRLADANRQKEIYDQTLLTLELRYLWCQKAFRRAVVNRKYDMLFNLNTLKMLTPKLIGYIVKNKNRNKQYREAIREFSLNY